MRIFQNESAFQIFAFSVTDSFAVKKGKNEEIYSTVING